MKTSNNGAHKHTSSFSNSLRPEFKYSSSQRHSVNKMFVQFGQSEQTKTQEEALRDKQAPPTCTSSFLLLHLQPLGSTGRQPAVQEPRWFHRFVGGRFADAFSFHRDDVRKQRRRPQTETCRLRTMNPQQQLITCCCCHCHPTCRETDRLAS